MEKKARAVELWDALLNLTLICYLHKDCEGLLRKTAKRYKKRFKGLAERQTMNAIIRSSCPSATIKIAHTALTLEAKASES